MPDSQLPEFLFLALLHVVNDTKRNGETDCRKQRDDHAGSRNKTLANLRPEEAAGEESEVKDGHAEEPAKDFPYHA